MMDEDIPFVDQGSLVRYIRAALAMDGIEMKAELIERVMELELEYLQHQGIAEQAVNDPRPEG